MNRLTPESKHEAGSGYGDQMPQSLQHAYLSNTHTLFKFLRIIPLPLSYPVAALWVALYE
jgi:hypothetical protein